MKVELAWRSPAALEEEAELPRRSWCSSSRSMPLASPWERLRPLPSPGAGGGGASACCRVLRLRKDAAAKMERLRAGVAAAEAPIDTAGRAGLTARIPYTHVESFAWITCRQLYGCRSMRVVPSVLRVDGYCIAQYLTM